MQLKVCSLFAGAGGIDLAFRQAGFITVWANEFDRDACKTFRRNFPDIPLIEKDIRKVDAKTIPDFDVLVGGFPCQPFSVVGRQEGFNDDRGNLFFEICRIIDEKNPSAIFLENVANLVQHDAGNTFRVIRQQLEQRGYIFNYIVANACDYGFPQIRNRTYIVCFKNPSVADAFSFPEKAPLKLRTWDIIDRTKPVEDKWYIDPKSDRYKEIAPAIKDERLIYRLSDMGILAGRNGIVFTLMAGMGNWPDREPMIKDVRDIRRITPYECFMLQGFPKDFDLSKTPEKSAYRQAGNSVCVPVIKQIADHIAVAMTSIKPELHADVEALSSTEDDTLVGTLRNTRQLEICLKYNFYHAPISRLPGDPLNIRFVAVYQSSRLFGNESGIRYVGRVTKIEKVRRSAIKELPKESSELYYRFFVASWITLKNAVKPSKKGALYFCNHTTLKTKE